MKKAVLLMLFMFSVLASVQAQDVITKLDGSTVEAKVAEITESVIKYHRFNNPSGPLYTVPISSILSIRYENGTVENFNVKSEVEVKSSNLSASQQSQVTPNYSSNNQKTSDYQLLKMASNAPQDKFYKKARNLRITAWVGGVALLAAGFVPTILELGSGSEFGIIGGAVVGTTWCVLFNVAANRQVKKARIAEYFNNAIIEDVIVNIGKGRLVAGINMMGNNVTHEYGLGVGFKLNF